MYERKISIDDVRKRLGTKSAGLKDKDVQEILNGLYFLCEQVVEQTVKRGNIVKEEKSHAD